MKGLDREIRGAGFVTTCNGIRIGVPSDHENRNLSPTRQFSQSRAGLDPVHPRHNDIKEDCVWTYGAKDLQGVQSVDSFFNPEASGLQPLANYGTIGGIVVDDEDNRLSVSAFA
jgi:hypothetical protein